MILLDEKKYHLAEEPLNGVTINNLFARSVVEKNVIGNIFVDNEDNPSTFYVIHPYGMTLLFGDCNNEEFNNAFKNYSLKANQHRNQMHWMQAFPSSWDDVLLDLYKGNLLESSDSADNIAIELNTRLNFKFNLAKYQEFKQKNTNNELDIVRTDKTMFENMVGSVVPSYFWDTAEDFFSKGIGFSVLHENKIATTAYSSVLLDKTLELGMETIEEFRGKGFAQHACSALIDYCLENDFEPIWACRLENIGSYKLAVKLGFEPTLKLPYYKLNFKNSL
ncbi:MAG: GNAT family N-acetyltransferase [Cytophagales bacterium]|nr:GNAT family N-acetyltransferase [Cytophagales bacterium]